MTTTTELQTVAYTPGPWDVRDVAGAGWEVRGVLPKGFKFDATYHEADGKTSFQTWVLASPQMVLVACERWVQFETEEWKRMQAANAKLIAAAPDLLKALETAGDALCQTTWELRSKTPKAVNAAIDVVRAAIAKAKGVA